LLKKVLAILLIASVSGCATLPVAGPVRIGPDLAPATDLDSFYYSPALPTEDASQTEIVNGFIAAGTGPQNDYAVAREYLSESLRSVWNPNQEVLIQRAAPKITFTDAGIAQLEIEVSAKIDANGKYESFPAGTTRILEFAFTQQDGQWRLSQAPDATVLIKPVFDVVFRGYSIYFLDRQQRYLVPELRYFPATPATGTRMVNALLEGPSNWLRPAVVSAIPSGTRLSIDAVTVEKSVALVDLTARALVASRTDRTLIKAQLDATLSQLPNVEKVAISIERSRQDIVEPSESLRAKGTRPLVIVGSQGMESLASNELDPLATGVEFFSQLDVEQIAISKKSDWLIARTAEGVYRTSLLRPGIEVELLDARQALAAINLDKQLFLWSIARASGSFSVSVQADGRRSQVSAPWLAGQSVLDFDLSQEGSRAVFLVQGAERNRVLVSAVIRDRDGLPLELTEAIEIGPEIAEPQSVSFIDDLTVGIVNQTSDFTNAYLVEVGGTSRAIPALAGTTRLVSAGSAQLLFLRKDDGELYSYRGSAWVLVRTEISTLAVAK
jgi:hypothetical protein